jgi:UDP-2,3-diacylglucosamine pyrophosphatase LpxH
LPFGDIHRSSDLCDIDKWYKFLEWAEKKQDSYFLGMGDYDDLSSTSERPILEAHQLHKSTRSTLEEVYDRNVRLLCKEISFMRGRLIGLIEGNHYSTFMDGTTTTQRMCQYLNCKYLGVSAFIRLVLSKTSIRLARHSLSLDVWAHHGLAGGRLIGSSMNSVQRMEEIAEADIFLSGHDHKKSLATMSKLYLSQSKNNFQLNHKKILLGRTGSFLKGYVQGKTSYVADAAMRPSDLGTIKIEITMNSAGGRKWIDVHGSL